MTNAPTAVGFDSHLGSSERDQGEFDVRVHTFSSGLNKSVVECGASGPGEKVIRKQHLAELQMAIMQILWDREEATVAEVREALLPDRQLAYTTVGTMLTKMENNGQVEHRSDGRVNIYSASIGPGQVKRTMISDLAARLFSGSVTDVVCHLLDGRPVSREELAELRQLIRDKENELVSES